PHSGKLALTGNRLCLQCHAKKYDDASHTFHRAGTGASECKSCHMPGTVYMGNDLRHDHTFRVPRPDLSVRYGTPNACNNCHTNRSPSWTASAIVRWYGPTRAYHFAEDLIPASRGDATSEGHIMHLLNDSTTPAIVRATAMHYLRNVGTSGSVQALLRGLQDSDAQVRYRSLRSLANFPAATWLNAIGPRLSDNVRAVRIAAADLLIAVPPSQGPPSYHAEFVAARNELEQYVLYQTDFAAGNVMAGDYYLKQQDYANAEKFYVRGLQKDASMNYARLNLSALYNATGRNSEALRVLQDALLADATNDRTHFNLALLYNELNDPSRAEAHLARAVALKSRNPRVYYNYGLLLQQEGRIREAIAMFDRGLNVSPADADLVRALCALYVQSNRAGEAKRLGCSRFDGQ
ncbi:MAG: tetratricopeptide repeat protein, partial [Gemmatimonadaceae bacterium]